MLGFWLFFFPESPKFLIECGETDEALEVLKDIFQVNTGNDRSLYPVSCRICQCRRIGIENNVSLFVVFNFRLFHYKKKRKSVPYHIKHRNPYVPWVYESRGKSNYFYRKFGYKRNYCANLHIYGIQYSPAQYNSVWPPGKSFSISAHFRSTKYSANSLISVSIRPFSYYTLMIWFPELFNRFEKFEHEHPGQHASVCEVSSIVVNG